jgi:hypothetical protein
VDGVELFQAWFSRRGFTRHRHDTYAIGVTESGVQVFDYRGRVERSLPGQVVVLHPDEMHDGRAGTEGGFGYRIVYVNPARIADAVRTLRGRPTPLPFVRETVSRNRTLGRAVTAAFRSVPEPLALDALVLRLAEGLIQGDPNGPPVGAPRRLDHAALAQGRAFLDSRRAIVRSADLEAVTGLSRYEFARQFRTLYGTGTRFCGGLISRAVRCLAECRWSSWRRRRASPTRPTSRGCSVPPTASRRDATPGSTPRPRAQGTGPRGRGRRPPASRAYETSTDGPSIPVEMPPRPAAIGMTEQRAIQVMCVSVLLH